MSATSIRTRSGTRGGSGAGGAGRADPAGTGADELGRDVRGVVEQRRQLRGDREPGTRVGEAPANAVPSADARLAGRRVPAGSAPAATPARRPGPAGPPRPAPTRGLPRRRTGSSGVTSGAAPSTQSAVTTRRSCARLSRAAVCAETTRWSRPDERVVDERAELTGAQLHEGPETPVVHGRDHQPEPHRLQQVPHEQLAHGVGLGGEGRGDRGRPHRRRLRVERVVLRRPPDRVEVRREHRRVEAGAERQDLPDHAPLPKAQHELADRVLGAADHRLVGRVVVGEHDVTAVAQFGEHLVGGRAEHGEHGAGHLQGVRVEPGEEGVDLVRRRGCRRTPSRSTPPRCARRRRRAPRSACAARCPGAGRAGTPRRRACRRRRPARRTRTTSPGRTGRPARSPCGSNSASRPGKTNAVRPPAGPSIGVVLNQTSLRPRHGVPLATALRASASLRGVGSTMPRRHGSLTAACSSSPAASTVGVVRVEQDGQRVAARGGEAQHPFRFGHRDGTRRGRRRGAGSSTTWALMPPKPKALTPALRGAPVPGSRPGRGPRQRREPGRGQRRVRVLAVQGRAAARRGGSRARP